MTNWQIAALGGLFLSAPVASLSAQAIAPLGVTARSVNVARDVTPVLGSDSFSTLRALSQND
jgi:hypothetical protein